MSELTQQPTYIIGIGASAGGLEALQELFSEMPDDLGVAYIVVQHLSPDFKSMMEELLGKNTNMDISLAQEGDELVPNHIYLIPAGKLMRIAEGRLYLSDLPPDQRINLPINELFRTLAEDAQNRAIGIVLSGTGSDGSRGILSLKEMGALVIAQDPEEAQFDGMPINAISTGAVDFVLPVREMPSQIEQIISHPLRSNKQSEFRQHLNANSETLQTILDYIKEHTDLDFTLYKESTVARRIEHRMGINNKKNLPEYWEYLQATLEETELVKQDLLIGVTQFFRDPEVWDELRSTVIVPLLESTKKDDQLRVWCAGCSTGEEAYTLALLFLDTMKEMNMSRTLKVFASDVDQSAVAFAAAGVYPSSIASEVPGRYLSSYFEVITDNKYRVTKALRSTVVFTTHNLIQDPPFSNMNLISCRNMLIYFQASAQQKALAFFHFALKLQGHMLLGSAESLGAFSNYFNTLDSRNRIYRKDRDIRIPVNAITSKAFTRKLYRPKSLPQFIERANLKAKDTQRKSTVKIGSVALIEHYVPPTFILNKKLEIIYSYGDTSDFTVKMAPGLVTNDLADVVRPDIISHCISAAHQVIRENISVILSDIIKDEKNSWSLRCFSFVEAASSDTLLAISLLRSDIDLSQSSDVTYSVDKQAEQRIDELDSILIETQKLYREALENLDVVSEELQSSNEELMAANEELQSTNEELQSVNEELFTVNTEHQQKISELTDANNDLENLLQSTQLAVLFITPELKIRRYTDALKQYVNIINFDILRDFRDLSFKYAFSELNDMVLSTNRNGEVASRVYEFDEHRIELSVSPYVAGSSRSGVILSMREIPQLSKD